MEGRGVRRGRVRQDGHATHAGQRLLEQLEPLGVQHVRQPGHARDVPARAREAGHDPTLDGIARGDHHDRDGRGRLLHGQGAGSRADQDEIHLPPDELRGQLPEALRLAVREPLLDDEAGPLAPPQVAESPPEGLQVRRVRRGRERRQPADPHRLAAPGVLRGRRRHEQEQRQREHAAPPGGP
jgi:hypothetical protein